MKIVKLHDTALFHVIFPVIISGGLKSGSRLSLPPKYATGRNEAILQALCVTDRLSAFCTCWVVYRYKLSITDQTTTAAAAGATDVDDYDDWWQRCGDDERLVSQCLPCVINRTRLRCQVTLQTTFKTQLLSFPTTFHQICRYRGAQKASFQTVVCLDTLNVYM